MDIETKKIWVARNKNKELFAYIIKPTRNIDKWSPNSTYSLQLNENLFPDLKWEDEAIELNAKKFRENFLTLTCFENSRFNSFDFFNMNKTNKSDIKPLDFVRKRDAKINETWDVGLVTTVQGIGGDCSVEWLGEGNKRHYNAWYKQKELTKIDSLPHLLSRELSGFMFYGSNRNERIGKFYEKE